MADWTDKKLPQNVMDSLEVDDLAVNYEISAGEYKGKNACTAWVNFNGTTTPPTIRDSYNVDYVIRTATGRFEIYFEEPMDNTNYNISTTNAGPNTPAADWTSTSYGTPTTGKFSVASLFNNGLTNFNLNVQVFGGKN